MTIYFIKPLIGMDEDLSDDFIREFASNICWYWILLRRDVSKDLIREVHEVAGWEDIFSYHRSLDAEFIREFSYKPEIKYLINNVHISEEILREHSDKLHMADMFNPCIRSFSNEFIYEFHDKLNWRAICIYKKLDADTIRKFKDKIHWTKELHQYISESIIVEFMDNINPQLLTHNKTLSFEFIKEHSDWLQPTKQMKKRALVKHCQKIMFTKHSIALELVETIFKYV